MRKFNIILTELAILLVVAHAFMSSLQVLGLSTVSIHYLPDVLLVVVLVHAVLGLGFTVSAVRSGMASGRWYARQNKGFWTKRFSGIAILFFLLFHSANYLDIVNGAFYLREFKLGNLPMLACVQFLKDLAKEDPDGSILLEPLSKFPPVKDLAVDRTSMFDILREMKVWTDDTGGTDYGRNRELEMSAGECLQCGCCLEVCPNFLAGRKFSGAAGLLAAYRAIEQNASDAHRKEMKKEYRKKFFAKCGQALSCREVCPKNLPVDEIQARANRQ